MKTKQRLMAVLALAMLGFSVFGLTACEEKHKHEWNEYVSKQATCTKKGMLVYSCYCGENYTVELPIDSDKHNIVDEACVECGKKFYSEGLAYELSSDGESYSVTGIGECTDTEIIIPSKYNGLPVMDIDIGAFSYCYSLTSVTIPDSVTSIGDTAFWLCKSLTKVTIPDSVTSIGGDLFFGCIRLTSIEVEENNTHYSSLGGNLYNKDQTQLIQYAIGKTATSFTIPGSVTCIGYAAFKDSTSLTSVIIPDSVTSIGDWAFCDCSSLTSVTIGDNVTSIGERAFSGCDSLTSVTIENSVTSIGESTFYECTGLTSITFNGTVEEWSAISKGRYWDYYVPATEVVCTNGRVSI